MNELQVFTNKECGEIRVLKRNGEAWFVAVDVCKALDINNARQAVTRLDDDEKCTVISNDGRQMNIVSESGLYSLVLSSRKKEAKTFKRWVTHDILPEIRKTGGYNSRQSDEFKAKRLEIMMINAKARLLKEQNKHIELMIKNPEYTTTEDLPPVVPKTYTATEVATMLGVSANRIGRLSNANGLKDKAYGERRVICLTQQLQ
jgi:prophage antirepressor-like protein